MTLESKIKKAIKPYMGLPIALSGGVDSSLLAALIKPKFAISVRLPGDGRFNEIQYSEMVCKHLGIEHIIVDLDESTFDESTFDENVKSAVITIGRPIPHFNIFPLFQMYKKLRQMGEDKVVLGDGPDETMCGYARDLIINYLYKVYEFEAFEDYRPMIDKLLPKLSDAISIVTGKPNDNPATLNISDVDILLMRPDMDDMSNRIARYFGIENLRPYQDDVELDNFMRDLPMKDKIKDVEFGKYALRKIAAKYLPKEIAWRKKKVGGPLFSPNKLKGWYKEDGEFGKTQWLKYQQNILDGQDN